MSRMARVVVPEVAHHVIQRGVRSMDIFRDDADRREYLRLMAEECARGAVRVLAWCLMRNHVHLVLTPRESAGLARAVGDAHRRYTRYRNFSEGVRGYLFQGRFFSCPLDEQHLIAAVRYVERNPVRAGLVAEAWAYPWSSAAYRVGEAERDALVTQREIAGAEVNWRALLKRDPRESSDLRRHTRTGRPLGAIGFVQSLESLTGRRLVPRRPGRPPKKPKVKPRRGRQ